MTSLTVDFHSILTITDEQFYQLCSQNPEIQFERTANQKQTKVLGNLLHCSEYGTTLGWLIYPEEESILIVFPENKIQLAIGKAKLPVLNGIELDLTVEQVFSWLKL